MSEKGVGASARSVRVFHDSRLGVVVGVAKFAGEPDAGLAALRLESDGALSLKRSPAGFHRLAKVSAHAAEAVSRAKVVTVMEIETDAVTVARDYRARVESADGQAST